ncbi:hypothetical protein PTKIN_Ptkin10aG0033000 [Pterospermum kingtungense]
MFGLAKLGWDARIAIVIWWLQKWQNERIFFNEVFSVNFKVDFPKCQWLETDFAFQTQASGRPSALGQMQQIERETPLVGWCKMNTDGASRLSSLQAGGGGVLSDHKGEWMMGFSSNIGPYEATTRWLLSYGLIEGLEMAWRIGCRKMQGLLAKEWKVSVVHALRESNMVANWLAKRGRQLPLGCHEFDCPPLELLNLLLADHIGGCVS